MIPNLKNKTALITGASSGLGWDFAHLLAENEANLIVVARRKDRLAELKKKLEFQYKNTVQVVEMDLTSPQASQKLFSMSPNIDILINNAGFGLYGDFLNLDLHNQLNLIDLNIKTLTELSFLYGQHMKQNKTQGKILNIASMIAYQASPLYGVYGASKSYVLHFSESIHHELKPYGITVTAFSPGTTQTEFFERSGQSKSKFIEKMKMDSRVVAHMALSALFQKNQSAIAGFKNKALVFSGRFLPRYVQAKITHVLLKNR